MRFKAVLFDLDGTLVDTIEDIGNAMNTVLSRFGFPGHGIQEYRYMVGWGMKDLVRRALPEGSGDDELRKKMADAMSAEYEANAVVRTRPYEGIPDLLEALTEKGLLLAVLSNKPDPLTRLVVRETLDGVPFAAVQGSLPGVPLKPDPASALSIARDISVDPEQMLYLGDSGIDMRTAVAASMFPVGALWGFRTEFELIDEGAKTTISSPLELLELL